MTEMQLLPELFAAQAARTPDAVAVEDDHRRLSYAELDHRANRLAYILRAQGVQPESVVGVCLTRGVDLVVALLATWKAGGAYLPIDPTHPAARNAGMITDSATALVLVDRLTEQLLTGTGVRQLTLEPDAGTDPRTDGRAPASLVGGALLLLLSDTAARLVMAPHLLPVSVLTAFLGAPTFLYLIVRGRRS